MGRILKEGGRIGGKNTEFNSAQAHEIETYPSCTYGSPRAGRVPSRVPIDDQIPYWGGAALRTEARSTVGGSHRRPESAFLSGS